MKDQWLRHLGRLADLTPEEVGDLQASVLRERSFSAGQVLVFEEDEAPMLFAVTQGWAAAVRELVDGSTQILDLFLPGQIVGLREVASSESVMTYQALTDLRVEILRKNEFQGVLDSHTNTGAAVLGMIAREEAWLMERITTLGQRNAAQCITHFLLEMSDRLALSQLSDAGPLATVAEVPLTQEQIGAVLGLTSVHVSRTLKALSDDGLVAVDGNRYEVLDRERAEAFADYDVSRMRM